MRKSDVDSGSNVDQSVQYFDQNFNDSGIDDDSQYKNKPRGFKMPSKVAPPAEIM